MWNINDNLSVTPLHVCTHGDTVSKIFWNHKILRNNDDVLISSSTDGYISIHKFTLNFSQAVSHIRYFV